MVDLSVVIPVKNEEANIEELIRRLTTTIESLGLAFELIFVTDHNKDNTFGLLKALAKSNPNLRIIKLSNAFGQHTAIIAGLKESKGEAVVIMDGDLQDYPEDVTPLYHKMKEGYDVVYGTKERKNDSALRNLFSKAFVKLLSLLSDYKLDFNTNMFRIMTRRTVAELLKFGEKEPSLTGLITFIGFPTTQIMVTSGKRLRGQSNYSFFRQLNFAISFLLSFSIKPLRIISLVGFSIAGLSLLYFFVVIIQLLFYDITVEGWPTLVFLLTLLGGIQLLGLGIVGEYIGRIFMETKNRPLYVIEEKIGDLKVSE